MVLPQSRVVVFCAAVVPLLQLTGAAADLVLPSEIEADFRCAIRCSKMTDMDRRAVEGLYKQAGCSNEPGDSWSSPVCASSVEQLCAGSCGGGKVNMAQWLPGAFGPTAQSIQPDDLTDLHKAYAAHQDCASRCSREGVVVSAQGPVDTVAQKAAAVLRRCGVVQLSEGAWDSALLERAEQAIAKLRTKGKKYRALLDQEQLHDGRYQVYLPFAAPFSSRAALGASDVVVATLEEYFGGPDFGIDHVSALTAASPSGNQSLHPDVSYFKGLAVSVHTALQDITLDMGPTYFCPCTGEALQRNEWPASAAIKMAVLKQRECVGSSHTPELTTRGTVTIYDGAMFHKGLANGSGRNRHILKLEVGASDFPIRRNYIGTAPRVAEKQTLRFRQSFGSPRMSGKATTRTDL